MFFTEEEKDEDQSEHEATEQQTNMAAWLVAASPSSSFSVLEAERKGVTLPCVSVCLYLRRRTQREKERERERGRECTCLPNSSQLSTVSNETQTPRVLCFAATSAYLKHTMHERDKLSSVKNKHE